ncbi:hypothetical protein BKA70DRAFT_1102179, partial [Coprinopsis sp. MPI-PUGE-AT-0042]
MTLTEQIGGGSAPKYFDSGDVASYVLHGYDLPNPPCKRFLVCLYTSLSKLDTSLAKYPAAIPCRVPLDVLAPKLLTAELKELCYLHSIPATGLGGKVALVGKVTAHVCTEQCDPAVTLVTPDDLSRPESVGEKALSRQFSLSDLRDALASVNYTPPNKQVTFTLSHVAKRDESNSLTQADQDHLLILAPPLNLIYDKITRAGIDTIAKHHRISLASRWSRTRCIEELRDHSCGDVCDDLVFVFRAQGPTVRGKKLPPIDDSPFEWVPYDRPPPQAFPPDPTTKHDVARCIRDYCRALEPSNIEYAGCCICAQLFLAKDIVAFDLADYKEGLLDDVDGISSLERGNTTDPIARCKGPVIVPGLDAVCKHCRDDLVRGNTPKFALAKGFWLGDVPDELKDLTLAEKAMVCRVRRNRTLVRVSKGHFKMVANVIALPCPTAKVYARLPPRREEMSDVIAVVFTGVKPPTDEDLGRTPVLVRRRKVLQALEWLKLNHIDYGDLEIDHDALATYKSKDIPVGVLHRVVTLEEGNVLSTAKAVFDDEQE